METPLPAVNYESLRSPAKGRIVNDRGRDLSDAEVAAVIGHLSAKGCPDPWAYLAQRQLQFLDERRAR